MTVTHLVKFFIYECHCHEKFEEPTSILVSKYVVENTQEFVRSLGKCPYIGESEQNDEFGNRKPGTSAPDR